MWVPAVQSPLLPCDGGPPNGRKLSCITDLHMSLKYSGVTIRPQNSPPPWLKVWSHTCLPLLPLPQGILSRCQQQLGTIWATSQCYGTLTDSVMCVIGKGTYFGVHSRSFQSHRAAAFSSGKGEERRLHGGRLAIFSQPCWEEVIRIPKEGAERVFPADSLERKVIIVISSAKSLVYQHENEQMLNSFRSPWHGERPALGL